MLRIRLGPLGSLIVIAICLCVVSEGAAAVQLTLDGEARYPQIAADGGRNEPAGAIDAEPRASSSENKLDVTMVNDRFSIRAVQVDLARLLKELDSATGSQSLVPDWLDGYRVSVRLESVPVDQVIEKVFEGLPFDYALVGERQIVVIGLSQPTVESSRESRSSDSTRNTPAQFPAVTAGARRATSPFPFERGVTPTSEVVESPFSTFPSIDGSDSAESSLPEFVAGQVPLPFFVPAVSKTGPQPGASRPDFFGSTRPTSSGPAIR